MSRAGTEAKRKTTQGLPAVNSGDIAYRPSHRLPASERSPYPTRLAETQYAEDELLEEEGVSGDLGVEEVDSEESVEEVKVLGVSRMAKKGEESEVAKLIKFMVDRDAEVKKSEAMDRRDREMKEAEIRAEAERREAEVRKGVEDVRRAEMVELFRQLRDEECMRRRED